MIVYALLVALVLVLGYLIGVVSVVLWLYLGKDSVCNSEDLKNETRKAS